MSKQTISTLSKLLTTDTDELYSKWIEQQLTDKNRSAAVSDSAIKSSSSEFLKLFQEASKSDNFEDLTKNEWIPVLGMLTELSGNRALQGSTPAETANFVFSLKQAIFEKLNNQDGGADSENAANVLTVTKLLDKLGLYTFEAFQKTRESVIKRQQKDIMEMSTPVIKIWDKILSVPLIGMLDSARTQIVMEALLQKIVETGARIAILDITGVATVDTQTAQHLMKTAAATRLMGAECIISGIRPQIAQTIVHLGIDITDVTTKATMADALREALDRVGYQVTQTNTEY